MCSHGQPIPGLDQTVTIEGAYGCAAEKSLGKDTQSGHWEMAGVPVEFEWGYFKPDYPSFPESLLNDLIKIADLPGVLGNRHASGTVIIEELGEAHQRTGKPIVYTSADSVFQIAAHEETFGLKASLQCVRGCTRIGRCLSHRSRDCASIFRFAWALLSYW